MASGLTVRERNRLLDATGREYGFAAAHGRDPGPTGAGTEIAGGSPAYVRRPISWAAAAGGSKELKAPLPVFDVPSGATVGFIGLWTAASGGTYGGGWDVAAAPFAGQGTYELAAGKISLGARLD